MDSKTTISPSFICAVCQDIYKSPFTLTACGHSFCQICLSKFDPTQFSILKPNYNSLYFTCPLCSKVTDIPSGDFEKDLAYAEEIELLIREWREKEFQFDDKYSAADICKSHLKVLEKFCLDDNQFICWMCHNFNYSDDHRGHKVVTIPEAYKVIKKQSVQNLNLLERMQNLVKHRIRYTSQCRFQIDSDLKVCQKNLNEYCDKIINDINILRKEKLDELFEEFEFRDKYMSQNFDALMSLSDEIKLLVDKQPDTLHGVLKQYKATCGFINTLSNGIIFPPANNVDITLRLPKYDKIKQIIEYCEDEMDISSTGLPDNVIEIINPLKDSKIIPEKEQTDTILNVLPNFEGAKLVYRLSEDKFLGQYFRNKVYDKGPTLTIISANKGHVFGGYSPISWTEGVEENWKTCDDSFLFTITDNKGRQPEKLFLDKKKRSTALFHSRISYAFGSGHDLSINLIDIKRSESALFSYMIPKNTSTDANRYLAGKRDGWEVDEFEVFLVENPIKKNRYEDIKTSLVHMAKDQLIVDGLLVEDDNDNKRGESHFEQTEVDSLKDEDMYHSESNEEKDSILDHSFLYKNLVKDVHLMNKDQLIDFNRSKHHEKKSNLLKEL